MRPENAKDECIKWWKMEGRAIIFSGYNVSVENVSIKELLIAHFDVIFVVLQILIICLIKQKRNYLVAHKRKAFKYGRFDNKKSTFFNESYLNLSEIVFKNTRRIGIYVVLA